MKFTATIVNGGRRKALAAASVMLAGVAAGAAFLGCDGLYGLKHLLISGFFAEDGQAFLSSLASSLSFLLLLFCLGFSAVSQPLAVLTLALRGFCMGLAVAYIYKEFGVSGIPIAAFVLLPNAVITAVILSLGARESLRMSNSILSLVFSKNGTGPDIRLYLIKFTLLAAFCAASSLLHGAICFLFALFGDNHY